MVQTTNRFFDEVARFMNDAAGVAQGVRREFETLFRTQAERFLRDLDVVKREEFEAVKDMARLAREENEALKARVAALEAALAGMPRDAAPAPAAVPGRRASRQIGRRHASESCRRRRYAGRRLIRPAICRPDAARHARSLFFTACAAISAASAAATAPLEAAAEFPLVRQGFRRGYHHGDRQSDQGGGAFAGRQGGRPGRTSRRPRTRNHLWRRQAAAADLARLRRSAPAHLCRPFSHDHS